jgi:hypothetical protein
VTDDPQVLRPLLLVVVWHGHVLLDVWNDHAADSKFRQFRSRAPFVMHTQGVEIPRDAALRKEGKKDVIYSPFPTVH